MFKRLRSNASNTETVNAGATMTKRSRLRTTDPTLPNSQEDGLNTMNTQRPAAIINIQRSTASINIQRPVASTTIQRPVASTTIQRPDHPFPNSQEDGLDTASTQRPAASTQRPAASTTIPSSTTGLQHQTANQPSTNAAIEGVTEVMAPTNIQGSTTGQEKKVRGRTRGVNADKVFEQLGTKIPVTLTKQNGRPTGPYAEMFANEIGFTVRNYAPMNVKQWKDIKPDDVEKLIKRIITKFDVDLSLPWVRRYVKKTCGTVFSNFRYKLKKQFLKFSTVEEALENKHEEVKTQEEWAFLCNHFCSEEFQIRSEINAINRSQLAHHHKAGSKSFMSHQEQIAAQTGEMQGAIDRFETEYKSNKKGWDLGAKAFYDEMIQMRTETTLPDGTRSMTDDEICAKVLGVKSGYIKGCGFGPRPTPSSTSRSSIDEMSEKNKELEDKLGETQHTIEAQQKTLDAQNQVIQELQEQTKKFEEFMANYMNNN